MVSSDVPGATHTQSLLFWRWLSRLPWHRYNTLAHTNVLPLHLRASPEVCKVTTLSIVVGCWHTGGVRGCPCTGFSMCFSRLPHRKASCEFDFVNCVTGLQSQRHKFPSILQ